MLGGAPGGGPVEGALEQCDVAECPGAEVVVGLPQHVGAGGDRGGVLRLPRAGALAVAGVDVHGRDEGVGSRQARGAHRCDPGDSRPAQDGGAEKDRGTSLQHLPTGDPVLVLLLVLVLVVVLLLVLVLVLVLVSVSWFLGRRLIGHAVSYGRRRRRLLTGRPDPRRRQ